MKLIVGGLFRGSFWGGGGEEGGKITFPCLKIVRIMLETWSSVRKYRPI